MRPAVLEDALAAANAAAFVHAGPPGDPVLAYLSGAQLPCRAAAAYRGDGGGDAADGDGPAVALVPERALPDRVAVREGVTVLDPDPTPARRLPDLVSGAVLAPPALPHDAALYLERAGVGVASTDAHERARARKTDRERAAVGDAQAAAASGLAAVAELLATADGDPLAADGVPVTAERARRTANAAMARAGATPETVVGASGALAADEPVPVRATPSVDGYHGRLARTFVADGDGGWERRATLACEHAIDAAMDGIAADGTTAAEAAAEARAELGSYGFAPDAATAAVHGVGLERREEPTGGATLERDAVLAVRAGLATDDGDVRLADLCVVTDAGVERVGEFPRSVVPRADY